FHASATWAGGCLRSEQLSVCVFGSRGRYGFSACRGKSSDRESSLGTSRNERTRGAYDSTECRGVRTSRRRFFDVVRFRRQRGGGTRKASSRESGSVYRLSPGGPRF